jgi:hypothetical protein
MIHQHRFTQQGWECPKCGRVYSPSTMMCLSCPQEVKTNITTTATCSGFVSDTVNSSSTKCMKCGLEKWQHINGGNK